ncbi:MAG: SDR family oxidoreductase [Myxococcota bacterium]
MHPLHNAGVIVTGASRGLGRALAEALALQGARLLLIARTDADLQVVVDGIRAAGGVAHGLAIDIGAPDAAARIAGAAAQLIGPVRGIVHNASSLGPLPLRPLLDLTGDDFLGVLQVNLLGPFRLTRALAGAMALDGGGWIVHISSDAAVEGYPTWGAYGVSKAALDHLGRIWAEELRDQGVRFLIVDPGEMDTQMHADAMPDADPEQLARPADVAQRLIPLILEHPTGARHTISEVA